MFVKLFFLDSKMTTFKPLPIWDPNSAQYIHIKATIQSKCKIGINKNASQSERESRTHDLLVRGLALSTPVTSYFVISRFKSSSYKNTFNLLAF